jgi:D-3-phosphoglycerate dehydrogenase
MKQAAHVGFLDQVHAASRDIILSALPQGWTITFAADKTREAQSEALSKADVAFVIAAPVTADLIGSAPHLKFIQKLGAGIDRVDQGACAARGIAIARLNASNAVPVAEHTVLMMLSTLRHLPEIDRRTRAGEWLKEEGRARNQHMRGKTVGLLGLGAIGRVVAELLSGFGVSLIYHDPHRAGPEIETALKIRFVDLDELIETSDILSLHLPLTPQTRQIINSERIKRMKPGSVVINCSRGGLIDEEALADALMTGSLFGAGLDTFAVEPPSGSRLLATPNTVITPHFAGATSNNFAYVVQRAFNNATTYLTDGTLPGGDRVVISGDNKL